MLLEQERKTGAKILASLMASEEEVLGTITGGLLEATSLLQMLSSSDPSMEVQHMCHNLLSCLMF